jgi:hypothetical protein
VLRELQTLTCVTWHVADAKIRAVKYFCKTLHKRAMISNLGGRLTNHLNGLHLTPEKRQRWSAQLQQQQHVRF